jgi:hypothetical protein
MSSSYTPDEATIIEYDNLPEQPVKIIQQMKKHQLATLKRCMEMEKKKSYETEEYMFTSFFGVIGDIVGSGKSLSILSLAVLNPEIESKKLKIKQSSGITEMFEYQKYNNVMPMKTNEYGACNLFIIPHTVRHQWVKYIIAKNHFTKFVNTDYIKT